MSYRSASLILWALFLAFYAFAFFACLFEPLPEPLVSSANILGKSSQ